MSVEFNEEPPELDLKKFYNYLDWSFVAELVINEDFGQVQMTCFIFLDIWDIFPLGFDWKLIDVHRSALIVFIDMENPPARFKEILWPSQLVNYKCAHDKWGFGKTTDDSFYAYGG